MKALKERKIKCSYTLPEMTFDLLTNEMQMQMHKIIPEESVTS